MVILVVNEAAKQVINLPIYSVKILVRLFYLLGIIKIYSQQINCYQM